MSDVSLAMNRIAEELKKTNPSKKKILNFLYDLQLYDFEFLNSIGETYKLSPLFFMKTLYSDIWKKMGKLLGKRGRIRGERYIVENYCLHGGEQILYECEGSIQKKKPIRKPIIKLSVNSGVIFITNYRIIAQGRLVVSELIKARTAIVPELFPGWGNHREYKREKKLLFEAELELCFGYAFMVRDFFNLKMSGKKLSYDVADGMTTLTVKKEQVDKLFDILNQFQNKNT
ncbi:MAG: hypothetical protein ACFFDY_11220 [Candidatus Thorarchaeota archaeon]